MSRLAWSSLASCAHVLRYAPARMSDVAASPPVADLSAPRTVPGLPTDSASMNVMVSGPPITANVNVATWQGSYFFSLIFSTFLLGIITHQVVTYRAQDRGEKLLRCWVHVLWLLVVTGTALDVYNCWTVVRSVEKYILTGTGVSISNAVVGSTAEIFVQLYFIRGIWKVRKELYPVQFRITLAMCGTYIFLALGSMAAWTLSIAYSQGVFDLTEIQQVITIKLSMSIVLDLCITFDLVVILRQNTSEFPSYKRQGRNKFAALAVFLVSRGTTLLAAQVLALVLAYNVDLISVIVVSHACLPRIYVWSMLLSS
ncbi:hypothetical protein PENSPDRAFT_214693 [Peniophora sp. CONT]|nr:hypothetical protein PENSPDRAFT_214693 [Peniophora sp. CONT]